MTDYNRSHFLTQFLTWKMHGTCKKLKSDCNAQIINGTVMEQNMKKKANIKTKNYKYIFGIVITVMNYANISNCLH